MPKENDVNARSRALAIMNVFTSKNKKQKNNPTSAPQAANKIDKAANKRKKMLDDIFKGM